MLLGRSDRLRECVFAQHTTVGIIGYKDPYPIRAVRDSRYKLIRNLAPGNRYEIGGIHKTPVLGSWKQDAKTGPMLAARIEWLSKRPAEELYDLRADEYEARTRRSRRSRRGWGANSTPGCGSRVTGGWRRR